MGTVWDLYKTNHQVSRTVPIRISRTKSAGIPPGYPYGSCKSFRQGPIRFPVDIVVWVHAIIPKYPGICNHFYVNDIQIYISFSLEHASSAVSIIESCIKDVFSWLLAKNYLLILKKQNIFFLIPKILICK